MRASLSRDPQDLPADVSKRSLSAITVLSGGRGRKREKITQAPVDNHWRSKIGGPTMEEAGYDMRRALHTEAAELDAPAMPRARGDLSMLARAGRYIADITGFRARTPMRGGTPVPKRPRMLEVMTRGDLERRTRTPAGHLDPAKHASFVHERNPEVVLYNEQGGARRRTQIGRAHV